ncbi:glycosyltransferase family 2 protein [Flavivirga algicola]|uniref:Glycosyltransferase n=1 Tax=Flavivirga algicola TaxID=2729136 RepID=A0ABX1RVZ2_9FLAO|nr:glycosyltransferase family 2 protein [Flavivirga algicola]NMH86664.1 glycosyltransferase [Flavivirga algicola]
MEGISRVSIIIPTRNRLISLKRTLRSISKQTCLPKEIIIIDSSDNLLKREQVDLKFNCDLQIIQSKPSVCLQRNIGIKKSHSNYIFLCDDDIEISKNYIEELVRFLNKNPSETIASGLIYEKHQDKWLYCFPKSSTLGLLHSYIFSCSLNFELDKRDYPNNFIIQKIIDSYIKKGNHISKSGWPCTISYTGDYFAAPIYGLGASIIRSKDLKNVLYDTAFYTHGVGDNYDLAIGLDKDINVIKRANAYHHKEIINRVNSDKAYYYRIGALHYILLKHKRFNHINLLFLIWSLIGNSILFLKKRALKKIYYSLIMILRIIFHRNLYQ